MKLTLSYQTQHLPPPFAYAVVIVFNKSDNKTSVTFNLEYLDRASVSDDELRAEGFSRSDDLSWSGELNTKWSSDIESFQHFGFEEEPNDTSYLHIALDGSLLGFPKQIEQAELVFQELLQAILETAEIEAPLYSECRINNKIHKISWLFAERVVELDGKKIHNWEQGRELLKTIYSLDLESIKPQKKAPENALNPGNGSWYEVREIQVLNKLKESIETLLS